MDRFLRIPVDWESN